MRLLVEHGGAEVSSQRGGLGTAEKLFDDQEEMSKKMGAALNDTFTKLMARD